jgi:nucleoside-diphosphate-sugar epimerase
MKQVLVTGASGFLGSEICRFSIAAGWRVRTFDQCEHGRVDGTEKFVGDLSDSALLRKACEGASVVVHAAGLAHVFGSNAKDYTRFYAVNVQGTENLIDAAVKAGVAHVVLVSSVSVYGNYPGTKCDESIACHPESPYATSKWQAELKAVERMAQGKGSLTILRFATIYGEGDRGNVAKLIRALDCGSFIWPGSGQNQKSLIYKEDAARACVSTFDCTASGTAIYNVSSQPAAMREIVSDICQALGRPIPRLRIPQAFLKAAGTIFQQMGYPGQLGHRLQKFIHDDVYDGSKFETMFEFRTEVSLAEGIRREVNYLRSSKP